MEIKLKKLFLFNKNFKILKLPYFKIKINLINVCTDINN